MKIFDLEYQFFLSLRKIRVWAKRQITPAVVLRTLSVAVIAFNIFFTNGPVASKSHKVSTPVETGVVLSQTTVAAKIPAPIRISSNLPDLKFQGKAALVLDATTSAVLFEKESQEKLPPASLTKLLTALLTLEKGELDRQATVTSACARVEGVKAGFEAGQRFTIKDYLKALLLPSAADAACLLAETNEAGQASPSARFVEEMNQKALAVGLTRSHFTNATGLDGADGEHYSTVSDLLKLVREDLKYPTFREIVSQKEEKIKSVDGLASFDLKNTNELLAKDPGFKGVKTGYTSKALGCLAFLYEKEGHEVIGVILGSPERFADAQNLVAWIFENYRWE